MNIGDLRLIFTNGKVEYTAHCQKRMLERDISRADVAKSILQGEIIEEYPLAEDNHSEKSLPSCLVLGRRVTDEAPIHIVVGYTEDRLLIISVCFPDLERWDEGFRIRRR